VIPYLLLIILVLACNACSQSDNDATVQDNQGINAQVIEALRPLQSSLPGKPPAGPDGPLPTSANGHIMLGLQHYENGEWLRSIESWIDALNYDPASATAYNNICSAYNQLEDYERAILACNKALALRPDFPRARANLNAAIIHQENREGSS